MAAGDTAVAAAAAGGAAGLPPLPQPTLPPVDEAVFGNNAFSAETYLAATAGKYSVEQVRELQKSMLAASDASADRLRRHVHDNYQQFITIARAISKLEGHVATAQSMLGELRNINGILKETASAGSALETKRGGLVTIAASPGHYGEAVGAGSTMAPSGLLSDATTSRAGAAQTLKQYSTRTVAQLQEMLDTPLERLLPANTTRRVLRDGSEGPTFVETPLLTPKVKQTVELTVLSDAVVVAVKKKSVLSKLRRVVIHAWPLVELTIVQAPRVMSDGTVHVRLAHFSDEYDLDCDAGDRSPVVLAQLQELAESVSLAPSFTTAPGLVWDAAAGSGHAEAADTNKGPNLRSGGMSAHPASSPTSKAGATSPLGNAMHEALARLSGTPLGKGIRAGDEPSAAELRWLSELSEELDVYIAHRDWGEAVELLVRAMEVLSRCRPASLGRMAAVRERVAAGLDRLAALICAELGNNRISRTQTRRGIGWLLQLGLPDLAHQIFLETRSRVIQDRVRQIQFTGDIQQYASSLCVIFPLLRNSAEWYRASFPHRAQLSAAFSEWVATEVDRLAVRFQRQVLQSTTSFTVMTECLQMVVDASRELAGVGLDVHHTLEQDLLGHVALAINARAQAQREAVAHAVAHDPWPLPGQASVAAELLTALEQERTRLLGPAYGGFVTESALQLYRSVVELLNDLALVMSMSLYQPIVQAVASLFRSYADAVAAAQEEQSTRQDSVAAQTAMLLDLAMVADPFLPRIAAQLRARFDDRPVLILDDALSHVLAQQSRAEDLFAAAVAGRFFAAGACDLASLAAGPYTADGLVSDSAEPSPGLVSGLRNLYDALFTCSTFLSPAKTGTAAVARILQRISQDEALSAAAFGPVGIQQFALDLQFLLRVAEPFVDDAAANLARDIIERTLSRFFESTANPAHTPLKDGEWLDARVDAVVAALGAPFSRFDSF